MNANGRRRRGLTPGGAAAVVAVATALACDDATTLNLYAPSPPSVTLEISGPESVSLGQTVQFRAHVRLSDGTLKETVPGSVEWVTGTGGVLEVTGHGVATGREAGPARISARLIDRPFGQGQGWKAVFVVPEGTFRLVGRVVDPANAPVFAARVEVVGLLVQAIINANGEYQLFGVPPNAEIRVTAPGYTELVEAVHLTGHATRDFTIALSAP